MSSEDALSGGLTRREPYRPPWLSPAPAPTTSATALAIQERHSADPSGQRSAAPAQRRIIVSPAVGVSLIFGGLIALLPFAGHAAAILFLIVLAPLVVWTAFTNTQTALYVYLAWCWCDGSIRSAFHQASFAIVGRDLVMAVVLAGWFFRVRSSGRQSPLQAPPLTLTLALFALDCLVQFFNPYTSGLAAGLAGLKLHLSAVPCYFLAYSLFQDKKQLRDLSVFLTLVTLITALTLLFQYEHGRIWTFAHYFGTDKMILSDMQLTTANGVTVSQLDRVDFRPPGCGTVGGAAALYVAAAAPFTFALLLAGRELRLAGWQRLALGGVMVIYVATIFLSGLRSSLVIALAAVLICALVCGGRLRMQAILALAVCLFIGMLAFQVIASISHGAVSNRFGSLFADPVKALHSDRQTLFDQFGTIAYNSPLGVGIGRFGGGYGRFGATSMHYGFDAFTEAMFGVLILETGIPGALLIAYFVFAYVFKSLQAVNSLPDSDTRLYVSALASVIIVVMLNCFASPILLQPPSSVMFWLCCGIIGRIWTMQRSGTGSEAGPVRAIVPSRAA